MILDREAASRLSAARRDSRSAISNMATATLVNDMFEGWLNEYETVGMFRMVLNELTKRDVWYELLNFDLVTPQWCKQSWPREEY